MSSEANRRATAGGTHAASSITFRIFTNQFLALGRIIKPDSDGPVKLVSGRAIDTDIRRHGLLPVRVEVHIHILAFRTLLAARAFADQVDGADKVGRDRH